MHGAIKMELALHYHLISQIWAVELTLTTIKLLAQHAPHPRKNLTPAPLSARRHATTSQPNASMLAVATLTLYSIKPLAAMRRLTD